VSAPDVDNRSAEQRQGVADDAFQAALIDFIMSDVALDEGQIDGDTDLLLTGLVDSLGVVLIVEWIETELGRTIDPADVVLENFQTVDAMMEFLRSA
jgi:acyl carrier protein